MKITEYVLTYNLLTGQIDHRLGSEYGSDYVSAKKCAKTIYEVLRGTIIDEDGKKSLVLNMNDFYGLSEKPKPTFKILQKIVKEISDTLKIEIDEVTNIFEEPILCQII